MKLVAVRVDECDFCEEPCAFGPNVLKVGSRVITLCDRHFGHVYPCDRCGELLHEQSAYSQPLDRQRDEATGYAGHFCEGCV